MMSGHYTAFNSTGLIASYQREWHCVPTPSARELHCQALITYTVLRCIELELAMVGIVLPVSVQSSSLQSSMPALVTLLMSEQHNACLLGYMASSVLSWSPSSAPPVQILSRCRQGIIVRDTLQRTQR